MKKFLFTLAAMITVALFSVSIASAQCAFNAPGKAKGLKSDMVRGYAPCGTSVTHPNANTGGKTGTPGCTPPTPYSEYSFDKKKGKCSVKSKAKLEVPCSDLSGINCVNVSIQAKCAGILAPGGVTPATGPDWTLATFARATLEDEIFGDQTIVDFPAAFFFPDANKGKLKGKFDTNGLLKRLFGAGNHLAECTSLETLHFRIIDPDAQIFATQGSAARPK